jgi:hypothetical protein
MPGPLPAPDLPHDALPEDTAYADTGCDVLDKARFPSCLGCPLPACIHDRPDREALAEQVRRRQERAATFFALGSTVAEIAAHLGISVRTVQRDLRAVEQRRAAR